MLLKGKVMYYSMLSLSMVEERFTCKPGKTAQIKITIFGQRFLNIHTLSVFSPLPPANLLLF